MYENLYIQVYRRREPPLRGLDYLGPVDPEGRVDAEYVTECSREDLEAMIPWESMRVAFGGGEYQCRFTLQQPGRRRVLRSRNVAIAGPKKATWHDSVRATRQEQRKCPQCGFRLPTEG